jgi:hypothetical protein
MRFLCLFLYFSGLNLHFLGKDLDLLAGWEQPGLYIIVILAGLLHTVLQYRRYLIDLFARNEGFIHFLTQNTLVRGEAELK